MVNEGLITVRHNVEVAHRLSLLPGKCEGIHGHSMWVELTLRGEIDPDTNILYSRINEALEFGYVKKLFRTYLDTEYDHRLLLNKDDPWAGKFADFGPLATGMFREGEYQELPGLNAMPGDPSTEAIAGWIADWASGQFETGLSVVVHETSVNAAGVSRA